MAREAPTWEHEGPAQTLGEMAALIAAVRAPRSSATGRWASSGVMRPARAGASCIRIRPFIFTVPLVEQEVEDRLLVVGRSFPDVVLEVDHTTDVRPGKLKLLSPGAFRRLWVEVPGPGPAKPPGEPFAGA